MVCSAGFSKSGLDDVNQAIGKWFAPLCWCGVQLVYLVGIPHWPKWPTPAWPVIELCVVTHVSCCVFRAIYFAAYSSSKERLNRVFEPDSTQVHMTSAGIAGNFLNIWPCNLTTSGFLCFGGLIKYTPLIACVDASSELELQPFIFAPCCISE